MTQVHGIHETAPEKLACGRRRTERDTLTGYFEFVTCRSCVRVLARRQLAKTKRLRAPPPGADDGGTK